MKWFIKAFRQYADFSGRAGRRELWMFVLFNLLFALAWGFAASLLSGLFGYSFSQGSDRLLAIYYSATAVPAMALGVRRLHDTGRSGWWLLVSLVPLVGGWITAAYALQLILEIRWTTQMADFHINARFVLYIAGIIAYLLYGGLLLARKWRLPLTDYVLMAASACSIILLLWNMWRFISFGKMNTHYFVNQLRIIVPLSLFAYAIANRLTVEQKTQTEPLDIRNLNAPPASQLFEDKSDEGAKSFLGGLSSAERVRVSGLNPILYHAVIKEKKGEEAPDIIMEDQTALSLIRRLRIDELEQLLASVEAAQEGDRAASSNMSRAATCYKKAADINPYNDTALMSYGCALANQGNLREGVKWVEKAVKVNPANERAKRNLQGIKRNL